MFCWGRQCLSGVVDAIAGIDSETRYKRWDERMRDVIAVQLEKRSRVQIERFPMIASD